MTTKIPPWLEFVREDPERDRVAALTPAERLQVFAELCELEAVILAGRRDRAELLASRDPMSPDAERQWLELIAKSRSA
ncbi:MAG: hypothetical protein JJT88_06525 [Gammaproteobacteria bacterium]|nr:hypothetical protein [Gammaproteobacteria bacterium]